MTGVVVPIFVDRPHPAAAQAEVIHDLLVAGPEGPAYSSLIS